MTELKAPIRVWQLLLWDVPVLLLLTFYLISYFAARKRGGRHVITRSARSLLREQREPAGESGGCLAGLGTSSLAWGNSGHHPTTPDTADHGRAGDTWTPGALSSGQNNHGKWVLGHRWIIKIKWHFFSAGTVNQDRVLYNNRLLLFDQVKFAWFVVSFKSGLGNKNALYLKLSLGLTP